MAEPDIVSTDKRGPVAVVGRGKLGTALSAALRQAGFAVAGPLGREDEIAAVGVVLLCIPEAQIETVARRIQRGPLVAHCSGSLTLSVLGNHEGFSMHPLLSVVKETTSFAGAGCAIQANSERARGACEWLAHGLGMRTFEVGDDMRVLYHAAASTAAAHVIGVAAYAERLMSQVGADRHHLVPLIRSALENWSRHGSSGLTGSIARGDELTVSRQREAVSTYAPDSVQLWDALVDATRRVAADNKPKS